jgi:hypothetical protein
VLGYIRDAQAFEIDCENEYVRYVRTELARADGAALDVARDEPAWPVDIRTVAPLGWTEDAPARGYLRR